VTPGTESTKDPAQTGDPGASGEASTASPSVTHDPGTEGPSQELIEMYERLSTFIAEKGLEGSLELIFSGEYLLMTLANDILFETGSTQVSEKMMEYAAFIAQVLSEAHVDNPFEIVVIGHTDNVPINTPRYPSNFYISAERALNFMTILVNESGLDPYFFSSRGVGETRPIASNDTPEGKQKNRRVEVLITVLRPEGEGDAILTNRQQEGATQDDVLAVVIEP
jgi:chemotaxis protein MotB